MAITVTINAVDRTSKTLLNQLAIDYSLGSDWTATFPVRDTDSTASAYRPSLDQSVTIADGATTLLHGTVTRVEDKPLAAPHIGTLTGITVRAKSQVVDQIVVTGGFPAGSTLHDVVDALTTGYLAAYSITLDAGMGTGATLEVQTYEEVTLRDIFNHLSTITGWVWRITPADVLEFFSVGTKTASYSLTAANKQSQGPVTWEKSRQQYVNSVYLRYGTESSINKTWTTTGNGVLTAWTLDYEAAIDGYILSAGYVTDDGVYSPLSPYPSGGTTWMYEASTNQLHRSSALPNTKVATFVYSAKFPQVVTVSDAGEIASNGRFSAVFEAPDIFDKDAATELATGMLRKGLAIPQWVRLSTRQGFVMPGDTITLTFADRTVSGSHLITQVKVRTIGRGTLVYDLTCLSGSESQSTWTDQLKAALGSGGANAPGGTVSGSAVPNFSGRFDEDVSAWTGLDLSGDGFESKLTTYINSDGEGPAVQLGRDDADYRWVITADSDYGSSPGTVGKLRFHLPRLGSTIECPMKLEEDGSDNYILLPGEGVTAIGGFYIGDYANVALGTPEDITGILTKDLMARNGLFVRDRTTRAGEWINVSFSAGNFTAGGSQTWTVASGDQLLYRWMLDVGKSLTLAFFANTTTVGGTPHAELRIAIPGGFTAAQTTMCGSLLVLDNGVASAGLAVVNASAAIVSLYKADQSNWTASTDNTRVSGTVTFEVT